VRYLVFEEPEDPANKSFFSEIISSISDVRFSRDGRLVLARDYLTLKVWDVAMERKPLRTIPIHDHLRGKLCDLYENDCIFDKFECSIAGNGQHMLTGSYNNSFHIYDAQGKTDIALEASKNGTPGLRHRAQARRAAQEG
jgi:serine/threonine-protein phosphatase 2A regulatory subunit B